LNYTQQRLDILKAQFGEPETLDQMFDWLLLSLEKNAKTKHKHVVGLAWSVSYRDKISNTHYAPACGETNWGCKDDKPRGYPGYTGRVWLRIAKEIQRHTWGSDLFAQSCTYPGTGGGGAYDGPWKEIASERYNKYGHKRGKDMYPEIKCYSWDFRFFHDDFPLIRDMWTKNNLFNVVATGKSNIDIDQYRVWEDPDTAEADKAFIEKSKEKNHV